VANRDYNGVNVLILAIKAMVSRPPPPAGATYKQISESGGQVRRGEKATTIVYFERIEVQDRTSEDPDVRKSIPLLKSFSVFNAAQADWTESPFPVVDDANEALPDCDATITATGATIRHGGARAYYRPGDDSIALPAKTSFADSAAYYATAFHELTHWTSAASRLDRKLGEKFGDPAYAFEELVAELGSAFLCATHGVAGNLQHPEYIANWLQALKSDNSAIFKASALAQKAATFISQPAPAMALAA
jgi:antirestriction protein ArdC